MDGGPIQPKATVATHVARIREDLEGTGWTVRSQQGRGYRLEVA